jgi:hypothetical protein
LAVYTVGSFQLAVYTVGSFKNKKSDASQFVAHRFFLSELSLVLKSGIAYFVVGNNVRQRHDLP